MDIFFSKCILPLRKLYKKWNRRRLTNHDFSIISSNCIGGCITHDLSMRFNSPFVNLWIRPADYLKMIENLKEYMEYPVVFIKEENIEYPVGLINDVKVYFQHYKSEEEAENKWNERKLRINYDNLFVIFTDRDGCTYEYLKEFDALEFQNKIVFTHLPYPDIKSAVYVKGFEKDKEVGNLIRYKSNRSIKKMYDHFDYVTWFNHVSG